MSVSSLEIIQERIESAVKSSPIAVFKYMRKGFIEYNAVFANTYKTQQDIKEKDRRLVGCYSGKAGVISLLNDLKKYT